MQTCQTKSRPGLKAKRGPRLIRIAALVLMAMPAGTGRAWCAAPESDADTALLDAWRDAARRIGTGDPWASCRALLTAALGDHPDSKYARHCRQLIDNIRASEAIEARLGPLDKIAPEALDGDALVYSRIDAGLIVSPLQLRGRSFAWDRLTQFGDNPDVACRLYAAGSDSIDLLIRQLDNQAATRSVRVRRQPGFQPLVMRVADLSLGLIEAISRCRFRTDNQLHVPFSMTSRHIRAKTIDDIKRWRNKTRTLSPARAVVWQLEHGGVARPYQMLQSLLVMDENEVVIDYLSERFHDGDTIDYEAAVRLIQAGSLEPLEFIHSVATAGRRVSLDMVRVVADRGRLTDFVLLKRLASPEPGAPMARNAGWHGPVLARGLRQCTNRKCIPVLVAVVKRFLTEHGPDGPDPVPSVRWPQHVIDAAVQVQTMTGVNFGLDPQDTPENIESGLGEMLRWWREDGQAVYDFYGIDPRAPGGIR